MSSRRADSSLAAAEEALLAGRIVDAAGLYGSWLGGSRGARSAAQSKRAHLLAANLALLAGNVRSSGLHLKALKNGTFNPPVAALDAKLLLLQDRHAEALSVINDAVDALHPAGDLSLRAALTRERGLARLEGHDLAGGQADLVEAERLAEIAGDRLEAAAARLDLVDSALAIGDVEAARAALPLMKPLRDELLKRCRTLGLRVRIAAGNAGSIPEVMNEPSTLAEANFLLAVAEARASKGEWRACVGALERLDRGTWTKAIAALRCEAALLRAAVALEENCGEEALSTLDQMEKGLAPGLRGRYGLAAGWLRMKAHHERGREPTVIRIGRKLLTELERRRSGLFAHAQLRKLSEGHKELYRLMLSLELRRGQAERAYNILQEFSARALARRSGRGRVADLERTIGRAGSTAAHRDHPGRWAVRRMLRRVGARKPETLRWGRLISILGKLSSEENGEHPDEQK